MNIISICNYIKNKLINLNNFKTNQMYFNNKKNINVLRICRISCKTINKRWNNNKLII